MAESQSVDKGYYQHLVGILTCLSHTRLDIESLISMVSQFMHSPTKDCFEVVYQVLKYLKGCLGKGLLFKKKGHMQIEGYTNVEKVGDNKDRKSNFKL